jgi:hypothetical protein
MYEFIRTRGSRSMARLSATTLRKVVFFNNTYILGQRINILYKIKTFIAPI